MKRYGYIDAIRGISIILVCLGHVFPMVCPGTEMNPVWRWFNIFEVGIFFAVSGYLTAMKDAGDNESREHADGFGRYAWKKIRGLIWPYVTFSVLALFALAVFYKCNGVPAKASLVPSVIEFTSLSGIGALWFLPTLCAASLIAYPGMKNRVTAAVTVAVSIALMYAGKFTNEFIYAICGGEPNVWIANIYTVIIRSIIASGLVVMGYYLKPFAEKLAEGEPGGRSRLRRTSAFAICIAMTIAATPLTGLDFRKIEFSGQPILIFVSVAAMMVALVILFKQLPGIGILEFFGRNSLIVLATHLQWFIVDGAVYLMRILTGSVSEMGAKYYAQSAAVLVIVLAAEYVICRIITRFIPWMVKINKRSRK